MTTLVSSAFDNTTPVTQTVKFYKSTYIKVVRLHINKRGQLPSGQITLTIYDKINNTSVASKTVTYTEINGITDSEYWHGMVSFEFQNSAFLTVYPTQASREYDFIFEADNLPILNTIGGDEDYNVPYVEYVLDYEKYISNGAGNFKYLPLYGDGTTDGLTPSTSDRSPLGIEVYTIS